MTLGHIDLGQNNIPLCIQKSAKNRVQIFDSLRLFYLY